VIPIETNSLTMRYRGRVTALDELTVAVEPGVVGLVGANGAGKSTLIKLALGLLTPTSGRIRVLGLDPLTDTDQVRSRVGYMPEHDCLPPDVSAAEFVTHMARVSGLPPASARERASETLRHVGLYEERYRQVGGYSTGMKQRVKLAQALVHDPELVLLDEPTNGLDPEGRRAMLSLVHRIGTEFGISVVVCSHLLGEIERICTSLVAIDGGRLLRSASLSSMTQHSDVLAIEVEDDPADSGSGVDALVTRLTGQGLTVRRGERVLQVDLAGEATFDHIRDAVAELGLSLHRLERQRHQVADLFRDESPAPAGGDQDAPATSTAEADNVHTG
jgi:ABC-2 type transport system ATP-binding protein